MKVLNGQTGWALLELILVCALLGILVFVGLTRWGPAQQAAQDVKLTARQIQHALLWARERASHDRLPTRWVLSDDLPRRYWMEQREDEAWQPIETPQEVSPRVHFSGDRIITFGADGTPEGEAQLWISGGSEQQEVRVSYPLGRVETPGL